MIPREDNTPTHLQGLSRYRLQGDFRCRCADRSFFGRFTQVMGALFEFEQLVLALLNNGSMRAILDALSVFWNWDVIARQRAKKEECLAFLTAYRIIKPMMKYCEWPLPSVFTYATRAWPSENEMLKQYVLLRTRVCNFFRNNAHYECNDFLVADTARVVPLQRSACLAAAQIRKLFRRRHFNGKIIDASSRPPIIS